MTSQIIEYPNLEFPNLEISIFDKRNLDFSIFDKPNLEFSIFNKPNCKSPNHDFSTFGQVLNNFSNIEFSIFDRPNLQHPDLESSMFAEKTLKAKLELPNHELTISDKPDHRISKP